MIFTPSCTLRIALGLPFWESPLKSKCRHLTGKEQNRNHRGFKAARKQAIKAQRKARRINRSKA